MFKLSTKTIFVAALVAALPSYVNLAQAAPAIIEQVLPLNGGDSVAIDGEWAVVGDILGCQVYIYKYDYVTNKWGDGALGVGNTVITNTITEGLPYTQLRNTGTCVVAEFGGIGATVSTSNGLLAVGAPLAKVGGSIRHGKIFFYQYDDNQKANGTGGWVQDTAIGFPKNPDGTLDNQNDAGFGESVSIRHEPGLNTAILLAGAPRYDIGADEDVGKVYLYEWIGSNNMVTLIGIVEGKAAGDQFGQAVTSDGVNFLVGAPFNDDGRAELDNDAGAAYLYSFNNTVDPPTITEEQEIVNPNGDSKINHNLGISVSLSPAPNSVMLLGGSGTGPGSGAVQLLPGSGADLYDFERYINSTEGGDVSQDGDTAGFGFVGTSVELYFDKQDITGTPDPDPDWEFTKIETGYGRDISISVSDTTGPGSVRVMVNGDSNNQAYAYYTGCGAGGELKANEWAMIGIQCQTTATISEIFTTDLGFFGTGWVMYKQDGFDYEGHQNAYDIMDETDVMVQGQGYWIISAADAKWQINKPVVVTGTPTIEDPLSGVTGREHIAATHVYDIKGALSAKLTPSSNIKVMLSNPFPNPIIFGDGVWNDPTADTNELLAVGSDKFELGVAVAYVYDAAANGYNPVTPTTPGFPGNIGPGEGFFIKLSSDFQTILGDANTPVFNLLQAQPK